MSEKTLARTVEREWELLSAKYLERTGFVLSKEECEQALLYLEKSERIISSKPRSVRVFRLRYNVGATPAGYHTYKQIGELTGMSGGHAQQTTSWLRYRLGWYRRSVK